MLAKNPYWLVKTKLLDVLTDLNFITIHYIIGSGDFQNKVIFNVFFELLKDEDHRVRNTCSASIVR